MTTATDARSWTGFDQTDGLDEVDIDDVSGIDRMVRIALRGPTAGIDRALEHAGFSGEFTPGVSVFEPALPAADIGALVEPRSAEDRWRNPAGRTLTRKVVRGATSEDGGTELVHIWAFTT